MTFAATTIDYLLDRIVRGEITARAAAESALDSAEQLNDALNAFLEINRKGALRRADHIDALSQQDKTQVRRGGRPIAIHDNICARGLHGSCGSRILGPYHPPYTAHAAA